MGRLIRVFPLLLLLGTACSGPGYGGPWHSIPAKTKTTEEIFEICREVLQKDGFGVDVSDAASGIMESKWKVQLSPHWYEGRRDRIEIRIASDEAGMRLVQFRAVRQINEEHQSPQILSKASWGDVVTGILAGCAGDLRSEMAGLRAEIEQLERTIPAAAPLWIAEGENAFPPFLDDHTARVPDFIYNHILGKLAKMETSEIDALTKGDFDLEQCLKEPDAFRGRFYRVRGVIGILRAQPCDSDSGLREVHAGLAWNDLKPQAFHAVEKPDVMMLHSDLVEFSGIFLKILRFTTREGTVVDAPFFLAKTVRKYY